MKTVATIDELRSLYDQPSQPAIAKVASRLTPEYRRMIEASPFVVLATVGPEGLDCSPRGDSGQVVRIESDARLFLPDWRGNNRLDSLSNIVRDPRLSLMFMIPGCNNVLRVTGLGAVVIEPDLLNSFEMKGKHPRSVIRIDIEEAYFQCARAIMRADLWNPEHPARSAALPTPGDMIKGAQNDFDAGSYDAAWADRVKTTMW